MKRKLMFFMTFLFIGIGLATAQTSKVTGLVTSEEDGQPVVGASVLVNGTTLGTITDIDGKFTISNVPSSSKTLRVSYVGMLPQEVTIKEGILKIVLRSDAKALDEVVVTALGIKRSETRLDLVKKNIGIFKTIIPEIKKRDCKGILLIVANPVDILTYTAVKLNMDPFVILK